MNPDLADGYLVSLELLDGSLQDEARIAHAVTAGVRICGGDVSRLPARTLTLARIHAAEHDAEHAGWLEQVMVARRIEPTLLAC